MGNKLNTPKNKLIKIKILKNSSIAENKETEFGKKKLKIKVVATKIIKAKTAKIKLEAGPAKATQNISLTGSLKFLGFTGTGLAHPKNGPEKKIAIKGKITVPTISIWATGFKLKRPKNSAVLSPLRFAIHA